MSCEWETSGRLEVARRRHRPDSGGTDWLGCGLQFLRSSILLVVCWTIEDVCCGIPLESGIKTRAMSSFPVQARMNKVCCLSSWLGCRYSSLISPAIARFPLGDKTNKQTNKTNVVMSASRRCHLATHTYCDVIDLHFPIQSTVWVQFLSYKACSM